MENIENTQNTENKNKVKFVNGLIFKRPSPKAPKWVKGNISIKLDEFLSWVGENRTGDWLNIDLKEGKSGKLYFALNEYKREVKSE